MKIPQRVNHSLNTWHQVQRSSFINRENIPSESKYHKCLERSSSNICHWHSIVCSFLANFVFHRRAMYARLYHLNPRPMMHCWIYFFPRMTPVAIPTFSSFLPPRYVLTPASRSCSNLSFHSGHLDRSRVNVSSLWMHFFQDASVGYCLLPPMNFKSRNFFDGSIYFCILYLAILESRQILKIWGRRRVIEDKDCFAD